MSLTTSAITGRVPMPNNIAPLSGSVTFTLVGYDTQGVNVVPSGASATFNLADDGNLPAGARLWRNTAGLRGTVYLVTVRWREAGSECGDLKENTLGHVQVQNAPSYTVPQLLNAVPPDAVPSTWWMAITQAQYDEMIAAVALVDADRVAAETAATSANAAAASAASTSLVLTSALNYYVATTGSDSNDGLSAGSPFATIQAAVRAIRNWRQGGNAITINVANGTYAAGADVGGVQLAAPDISSLTFIGNVAAPSAVIIDVAGGNCFNAKNGAKFRVEGFTLRTSGSGSCLNATTGGVITHGSVVFGTCAGFHKQATDGGMIFNSGDYTINGGAVAHIHVTTNGYILTGSATVTLTGTPAFSQFFCGVSFAIAQFSAGVVWAGSATGKRFSAHNGGAIRPFTSDRDWLPGDTAGDAYGGGSYEDVHTLGVYRANGPPLLVVNETDASGQEVARFRGQRATPTNGDAFWNHFQARDAANQDVNVGRITWTLTDTTNNNETGHLMLGAIHQGGMVNGIRVTGTSVQMLVPPKLPVYTVATVPSAGAAGAGTEIYVSNESGGGTPAFSDGTVWRRVYDRAVIS